MKIDFVHIQNFRKLKSCRIDFSEKETIFVGANNSGKTSAMDALILFFKARNKITTRDFTLSNWTELNAIGEAWIKEKSLDKIDLTLEKWESNLPTLDIWLNVTPTEIHYVNYLIPTLEWRAGSLGVRLRYEPKDITNFYTEFASVIAKSKSIIDKLPEKNEKFKLWPKDMWDFLEKEMHNFFSVKTYLLNPDLKDTPQKLTEKNIPLEFEAFNDLIKVDIINAQRGFSDVNTDGAEITSQVKNLSSQLRSYYDKHLNPSINPSISDINALQAIESAKETFDNNLQESFKTALKELEFLNYPGFGNPRIRLSTKFNTIESLNHDSSVQYDLSEDIPELSLPEKYNGLGYQNLISMIFKLIRFRDEWMQVGKSFEELSITDSAKDFEPLHLILIEEPEAHLHAQVQQVFIKEAYKVLRNHKNLGEKKQFSTQLVISTHSNHIAHGIDFTCLRYFKREIGTGKRIHTSTVVNLSKTFGSENDTTKFAIRYLKTTHCDLFFADAVIMVEGPVERMLLPYFIKEVPNLSTRYISILEIGGSHAHRLKPFVESLGVITLIVTDIDAISGKSKIQPDKGKGYKTGNDTLKSWLPCKEYLDDLYSLNDSEKQNSLLPIRVAFQIPIQINNGSENIIVYPYTFEDSLVMENKIIFESLPSSDGLLGKMITAAKELNIVAAATKMYEAITDRGAKKAEFALELLYFKDPYKLCTPKYIQEGLAWIETQLLQRKDLSPLI